MTAGLTILMKPHGRRWNRLALALSAALLAISSALGIEQATSTPALPPPASAAVPAYRQANHVAILTVHGVIDSVTLKSLERRMKKAQEQGADAVVLDINTPGGEMFSTLEICNLLKNRTETPANLVAWIHPTGYSAGTFIALACREIVVAPASTFGDAAPINLLGQQMAPTERAKMLSPLLSEIIDSARRNHYDEKLVQAFVMLGQELWMVENAATGERVFVDRAEYRTLFGEEPAPGIGAITKLAPRRSRLLPYIDKRIPRASDHAALDPAKLKQQIEFEQMLPPVRPSLTEADRGNWQVVMQVTDGTTLLTVKADEAVYFGLANAVVGSDAELLGYFGAQSITRYDETWSEELVRFLISWPVKAILIIVFLVCMFIEMATPGFGVFGTASVLALLVLVGAPALAGMAQWWHVLLIVLGLLGVAAELFLLPGIGIIGVIGAVCVLGGLVGTFVSGDITTAEGQNQMWFGLLITLMSVFLSGVGIWFVSQKLHSIPIVNRLILHTELRDADEMSAMGVGGGLLAAMAAPQHALAAGDTGVAETDLRPAGRANVNGRLVDVKSNGTYIDKGTPIRVVSVGRFVIEVEEAGA